MAVLAADEIKIVQKNNQIIKLLLKFFSSSMTKEELRLEYIELLVDWQPEDK